MIKSLIESERKVESSLKKRMSFQISNENSIETKSIKIINFDGQIDPSWVENLTVISNENKVHSMSNGDTIFLDDFKIFFETHNLNHCSPSLVTITFKCRCLN